MNIDHSILTAYRGSISHGMYLGRDSIDDRDLMALCVLPIDYYFGLSEFGSRGTREIKDGEWDVVVYDIKKAIGMLLNGNPNILSLLWTDPKYITHITREGQMLLDYRHVFVGKHVYKPFVGYAYSQLHKMEHGAYQGYMGEKRRELVNQFGYDTKNAAHLIRLLRMCREFLGNGELIVERPDADELLAIKRGEWGLEAIKREAEREFASCKAAYEKSRLPETGNKAGANRLLIDIIISRLRMNYP